MLTSVSACRRLLYVPVLISLCIASFVGNAAASSADGWQKLWANDHAGARTLFRAALKANPGEIAAMRGLAVIASLEDAGGAAAQAWAPLFAAAPGHWSATAHWPRLVAACLDTGRPRVLQDAARKIVASRSAPPELRTSAQLVLADAAAVAGNRAEADRQWAALGYVRKWQAIGPFDNTTLTRIDTPYPPETEVDFARSYRGADGVMRSWFRLAIVAPNGACCVDESLGHGGPGVFYAVTALSSSRERAAVLRFDPTGASRVWLNGALIVAEPVCRTGLRYVVDPIAVPVSLRAGWNTVMVKLAGDDITNAMFTLRFTGPSGEALTDLRADPARAAGAPASRPGDAALAPALPAQVALVRKVAPARDPEALAAAGRMLFEWGDKEGAATAYRDALKQAPQSGWLHWELSLVLSSDGWLEEAKAEGKEARKRDPHILIAECYALSDEDNELGDMADRIRDLKRLLGINPASAFVLKSLAEAYSLDDQDAAALNAARASFAASAGISDLGWFTSFLARHGRHREAEKAFSDALRQAPASIDLLLRRARYYEGQEKNAQARADHARILALDSMQMWTRWSLADQLEAAGNWRGAADALRVIRRQCPQDADACVRLAVALRKLGDKQEALGLYRTALRLDPTDWETRETLRTLAGEKPVVDLEPPLPIQPILAKAPAAADAGGAKILCLLDEMRQVIYPDGAAAAHCHQAWKVFDPEAWAAYVLDRDRMGGTEGKVDSARVIKANGKVENLLAEPGLRALENVSYALSSAEPEAGDVVDIVYRTYECRDGELAGRFWTSWFCALGEVPVKHSRYVLFSPPGMPLQTAEHGGAPAPTVKDVPGWRIREWRTADVPAYKAEPMGPEQQDCIPWVGVSTFPSWAEVARWACAMVGARSAPDAVVRAKAVEVTREAKTEVEKRDAIIRYVTREIEYGLDHLRASVYLPAPGKRVIGMRRGDCKDKSALLTAMLAAVGIKADLVLLSGRTHGVLPHLPSPDFAHVVTRISTPEGPLWVDTVPDQTEVGGFPSECQGVPALVVNEATTDLIRTPELDAARSRTVQTATCALGADGRVSGTMDLAHAGDHASVTRWLFAAREKEEWEDYLRGAVQWYLSDAVYESGSVENAEERDKPLLMRAKFRTDRSSADAGDLVLVRLPVARMNRSVVEALLTDAPRTQDMELAGARGQYLTTVRLEVPPGYAPHSLRAETRGESPFGSYRRTERMEGNTLHMDLDVRMTPLRVSLKDRPQYLEFLRVVERESGRAVVFKKP